jgi:hypothetical protein
VAPFAGDHHSPLLAWPVPVKLTARRTDRSRGSTSPCWLFSCCLSRLEQETRSTANQVPLQASATARQSGDGAFASPLWSPLDFTQADHGNGTPGHQQLNGYRSASWPAAARTPARTARWPFGLVSELMLDEASTVDQDHAAGECGTGVRSVRS